MQKPLAVDISAWCPGGRIIAYPCSIFFDKTFLHIKMSEPEAREALSNVAKLSYESFSDKL